MSYEIPAGTARIINKSKNIAIQFNLLRVSSLCLLLSAIENEQVLLILKKMNIDTEKLESEIKKVLSSHNELVGEENSVQPQTYNSDDIPLDADCTRVMKLVVLEDKLANGKKESSELVLLALLHDRQNEAKKLLADFGADYAKLQEESAANKVSDDFSFPNEDDSPYPNDNSSEGSSMSSQAKENVRTKSNSDTPVIDNFGTDLTAVAAKGGLDPVVGREKEILRVVQILCRRKKNNPIIIGEPGVGKSAIVEGLADQIAHHRVPHLLTNKRIVALNMATIVAGTQYRGQFEERLRRLIKELKAHPEIVLFIDEIHTIIGAGSAPGSLDAANILKPALARGEVQCIGSTTTN